ncbi:hypothetical protein ACFLIM_27965 [Nonomuraea sp. M3C6]|uniref:Uncharacterized protein n=1 Tax=Nonomuraea marmarensis TaxID=3351344 RepID=A0ABW7AKQ9_9ACTN
MRGETSQVRFQRLELLRADAGSPATTDVVEQCLAEGHQLTTVGAFLLRPRAATTAAVT